MTSTLTNQRRVFKACLAQTERVSDDVTRKIGPLDFITTRFHEFYESSFWRVFVIWPNCGATPRQPGAVAAAGPPNFVYLQLYQSMH